MIDGTEEREREMRVATMRSSRIVTRAIPKDAIALNLRIDGENAMDRIRSVFCYSARSPMNEYSWQIHPTGN